MTLKEQLNKMKDNKIVAIGAKDGTGFVYIGEAGNRELIEKCFDKHHNRLVSLQQNYKLKIEHLVREVSDIEDFTDVNKIEHLGYSAAECARDCSILVKLEPYIKGTITTFDREVRDVYHKDVDNCTAIIVDGFEAGGFWTKAEFDRKYK